MRVALDTNVLAYAEGIGDVARRDASLFLLERLPAGDVILPAQVMGELFRVLTGKGNCTPDSARDRVLQWTDSFEVVNSTWSAFQSGFDLSVNHGLQIWDALILSIAAESRCRILLSEDMQNGFTCRGVTVVNPFCDPIHPLMLPMLADR